MLCIPVDVLYVIFLYYIVRFDKIKFPIFMHIKSPDNKGLSEFVPVIWWETVSTGIYLCRQNKCKLEDKCMLL